MADEEGAGPLLLIGGGEDREGECRILRHVVECAGGADAVIAVIPTAAGDAQAGRQYVRLFRRLGAGEVHMAALSRRQTGDPHWLHLFEDVTGVFFTGGDQLRLTSALGGTDLDEQLRWLHHKGVLLAGTSAGAAAMSGTMIVGGPGDHYPQQTTARMAPGMGFLADVVIDQHFAERGRIGRLLSAVAQNPHMLGIGIDEDTAVRVRAGTAEVFGSGTVTVVDAAGVEHTNISEQDPNQPLALTGVGLHILPEGYGLQLRSRRVMEPRALDAHRVE